jgi:hypothetical protein
MGNHNAYENARQLAFKLSPHDREQLLDDLLDSHRYDEHRRAQPTSQREPLFPFNTTAVCSEDGTKPMRGIYSGFIILAWLVGIFLVVRAIAGADCAGRTESFMSGAAVEEMRHE